MRKTQVNDACEGQSIRFFPPDPTCPTRLNQENCVPAALAAACRALNMPADLQMGSITVRRSGSVVV